MFVLIAMLLSLAFLVFTFFYTRRALRRDLQHIELLARLERVIHNQ